LGPQTGPGLPDQELIKEKRLKGSELAFTASDESGETVDPRLGSEKMSQSSLEIEASRLGGVWLRGLAGSELFEL
jgi:hypothetical protein